MATADMDKTVEPWMDRLHLPGYRVSEAARYVGVHPNTVSAWHYREDPVLPGRTKGKPLSYLELIEVAFVAFFRRLDIDMDVIRKARAYRNPVKYYAESHGKGIFPKERNHIVRNIEKKYPFVSLPFKTEAIRILKREQKRNPSVKDIAQFINPDPWGSLDQGHDEEIYQFADFDYDHGIAVRWHPAGRHSQVMIDPKIAFGDPMVSGLPTWVIRGRYIAGRLSLR